MDRSRTAGRVAAAGGLARRFHFLRFSSEQRAHLGVVLALLALAIPLQAQNDIRFDPAITQREFSDFSRVIAQGIYASPVHPAGAAGLLRFDVGVAVTLVHVDTNASYWLRSVSDDFTYAGDYVGVPRLVVTKGLGAITVAGSYAKIPNTDISVLGGSIDLPLIRGGLLQPTAAVRGTYSTIRGVDVYDLRTYGVEGFVGKGFTIATVYGGYGVMRSNAEGRIPNRPEIVLKDESSTNRITLGVRISLGFPKLVIEGTQAEERAYSAKLSFGL